MKACFARHIMLSICGNIFRKAGISCLVFTKTCYHNLVSKQTGTSSYYMVLVLVLIFSGFVAEAQGEGFCASNQLEIDLRANPAGIWHQAVAITPDGPCCGMPSAFDCLELIIKLHDDATSFTLDLDGLASEQVYILTDCSEPTVVAADGSISLCAGNSVAYYSVTICGMGNPSFLFTVTSSNTLMDDVSLDLGASASVCFNGAPLELVGGSPAGGQFFINGADTTSTHFYPGIYGPGDHIIEYRVDFGNGCIGATQQSLTVTGFSQTQCQDLIVCEQSDLINLAEAMPWLPAGGDFELTDTGEFIAEFDPATPGTYEFIYHYADAGCSSQCTFTIHVAPLPEVTWNSPLSFCAEIGLVALGGTSPSGGIFSGDYVENDLFFDTDEAKPDIYNVTYTYTDANGCLASIVNTVTIHSLPVANAGDHSIIAIGENEVLNGSATGGSPPYTYYWSPSALVTDPANPDTITRNLATSTLFTLTVTDSNGCSDQDDVFITVENSINVTLEEFDPICLTPAGMLELSGGSPSGGSYYINNQENPSTVFIPSLFGPGEHTIHYVYEDFLGRWGSASRIITVNPLPVVQWEGDAFCPTGEKVLLEGAIPEGGFYGGGHVDHNGFFNLASSGPGLFSVNYTYTDANGCTSVTPGNIRVHHPPNAGAGADTTILAGTTASLIAEGGANNYSFLWEPSLFVVDPHNPVTSTHEMLHTRIFHLYTTDLTTGDLSCQAQGTKTVNITSGQVNIESIIYPSVVCDGETAAIEIIVSGGVGNYHYTLNLYETGDPIVTLPNAADSVVIEVQPIETTEYLLHITDDDGNWAESFLQIAVSDLPSSVSVPFEVADFFADPVCASESFVAEGEGSYFLINEWGHEFDIPYSPYPLSNFAVGDYWLHYQEKNEHGCAASDSIAISILPFVKAEFLIRTPDPCRSNEVIIRNISQGTDSLEWIFQGSPDLPVDWHPDSASFTLTYPVLAPDDDPVTYTVTLRVWGPLSVTYPDIDRCFDEMELTITVRPRAQALFSIEEEARGCAPLTLNFQDESLGEVLYYFWRFGDGSTSMEQNPEKTFYNFSGEDITFDVNLTIATQNYSCTESYTAPVTVYPQTEAGFAIDHTEDCHPFQAVFQNSALHADWIHWDLGDGNEFYTNQPDTLLTLEHEYLNIGNEPDTLTVIQSVGLYRGASGDSISCVKTFEKQLVILPYIEALITTDPAPESGTDFIEGCAPFTVNFSALGSPNAHSFSWDFDDGGSSSKGDTLHTFHNTTENTIIYTVELRVETLYGCVDYETIEIHVHPQIQASFDYHPQTGCSPLTVNFNNTSASGSAMTFDWLVNGTSVSTSDSLGIINFNHNDSIPQDYIVQLVAQNDQGCISVAVDTITVYPQVTAQIYTIPEATGGIVEICASESIQFFADHTSNPSLHADNFQWDFGYGDASSSQTNPLHTFSQPGTYTVALYASSEYTCSDAASITVVVHPQPDPGFMLDIAQGCSPLEVNISYNALPVAGSTYSWDFDFTEPGDFTDYDYPADALPATHTFYNTGTETATYQMVLRIETEHGCIAEHSRTVTVWPEVTAQIATDPESEPGEDGLLRSCANFTVAFDATGSLNTTEYHWDFGDGITSTLPNPVHTFLNFDPENAATYDVLLTASSPTGCFDQQIMQVEVAPRPLANFIADPDTECAPAEISFTNLSVGASEYLWDFGDGNTSTDEHPTHTYTLAPGDPVQTFTVLLYASHNGCSDSISQEITIYPPLVASFEVTDTEGCHPFAVTFENTTQGSYDHLTFEWDFGDGNSASFSDTYTHTFYNYSHDTDVIHTVRLTANYGNTCISIYEEDITVLARPRSRFTVTNSPGCAPHEIEVINQSEGASSFSWNFGDGSDLVTVENPLPHLYDQPAGEGPGVFTITLDVEGDNGCPHQYSRDVTIYPAIEALFTMDITEGCHPLTVEFTNESSGVLNYRWDYGDGNSSTTSAETHTHTFHNFSHSEEVTYTIELWVESAWGCKHSIARDVTVYPLPDAAFTTSTPGGCSALEVTFTNNSTPGHEYAWFMDNGTDTIYDWEPAPQTYEVAATGQFTIFNPTLMATSSRGCQTTYSQEIYVFPNLEAGFEISAIEGCHPLTIEITNTTQGDNNHLKFVWEYGDGNTSATTSNTHSHTYHNYSHLNDTTYTLRLTAYYGDVCIDTYEMDVTVLARPLAKFTVPNSPGCAPHAIEVENLSVGATGFSWNFGIDDEIITDEHPDPYTYTQPAGSEPGLFTISLNVAAENECTHSFTQQVTIFPEVQAQFESNIREDCHPLKVDIRNLSEGATQYIWSYGDGNTSSTSQGLHSYTFYNFSHLGDAVYNVQLLAESEYGCTDLFSEQFRVNPVPMASFVTDKPGGCAPLEVDFENTSIGASSYAWSLGDGSDTIFAVRPDIHTYQVEPGSPPVMFEPTLKATSNRGCKDIYSKQLNVYPDVVALFNASDTIGCHPFTVEFSDLSPGDKNYLYYEWNYGDGNSSSTKEDKHFHTFTNYSHTDDITYTVTLTVYYSDVCFDVFEKEITVLARPLAHFTIPNNTGCAPHTAQIENLSQGVLNYNWNMGDGSEPLTIAQPGYHEYHVPPQDEAEIFIITLDVEGQNGCTHQYSRNITVYPEVTASFALENNEGCHPLEVSFENQSSGAHYFHWDLGDGTQSQETPSLHTYLNHSHTASQSYQVHLNVSSHFGCEAAFSDEVIVRPRPEARIELSGLSGCSPFSPHITNLSSGATAFNWSFGDGDTLETDQAEAPEHTWSNLQESTAAYPFQLLVSNEFGCEDTTEKTLTVFPEVTAQFVAAEGIYSNCSPFDVRFENQSQLGNTYVWDFGDGNGSISTNPLHSFKNETPDPITYDVLLQATSVFGCTDTTTRQFYVYPTPVAEFGATPEEQPYPNATVTITNRTNPGQWEYTWDFGDGNVSDEQNPVFEHTYIWDESDLTTKTYTISLRAANDYCYSNFNRQVTITSPVPQADLDAVLYGCQPLEISFENTSLYAFDYRWYFGDGTVSYDAEPVHTWHEPGIYDLVLIAIGDGGRDTLNLQVEVFANPTADFVLQNTLLRIPYDPLRVTNTSKLASYYYWEFGDGNNSSEFEPVHYYDRPGVYDITLTVHTNTYPQCTDVKVLANALRVDEACQVIFPNAFAPSAAGPTGGAYNPNNPTNEVFHPLYEGIETYELEIFNRWGELIYRSSDPDIGWDGYVGGRLAQSGVYVWRVRARCTTGFLIEKAGDVTLIR